MDSLLELLGLDAGHAWPEDIGPRVNKERDPFLACHLADGTDAGTLKLDLEQMLALTDAVLEVDPDCAGAQDSPHVLGHVLRFFRVSPFHVGSDGDVHRRGDASYDVQ